MKYRLILLLGICALLNGWSMPGDYLVRPDSECSIPLAGFTAGDEPAYLVRNYDGRQTGSGRAELSGGAAALADRGSERLHCGGVDGGRIAYL